MSLEQCKLCKKECTPWFYIHHGHICQDCYENSKKEMKKDNIKKIQNISYLLGIASALLSEIKDSPSFKKDDRYDQFFKSVEKIFYDE